MYTISQAAARSNVSVPLLRAWERRYHIVQPARTAAGYRLYDEAAIDRIRAMRRLVDAGWTPSTAATAILGGDPSALAESRPPDDEPAMDHPVWTASQARIRLDEDLIEAFVDAAVALDAATLELVLDRMFASGTFETVAEATLLPALAAVGEAWAAGHLSVASEHAASHAVLRRLGAAYQAAASESPRDRAILVGLPPTVRHELGALAFSTAARRAGLPVVFLGPDLPVEAWVAAVDRTRARAVVVGVLTSSDIRPAIEVAVALRTAHRDLTIAFGGRQAVRAGEAFAADPRRVRPGPDAQGPDGRGPDPAPDGLEVVLPEPLRAAVRALENAVAS